VASKRKILPLLLWIQHSGETKGRPKDKREELREKGDTIRREMNLRKPSKSAMSSESSRQPRKETETFSWTTPSFEGKPQYPPT